MNRCGRSAGNDYEIADRHQDVIEYAVALANRVDIIITRNKKDFESGSIPVMTPKDFLSWLALD